MWKVVGFKYRDAKNGSRYYDVYCQRECAKGAGLECTSFNFDSGYHGYVPVLNDIIVVSTYQYEGRTRVRDITKIK